MTKNDETPGVPDRGCLLGLDYGSKRVGVAVCDTGQQFATPLKMVQNDAGLAGQIGRIIDEYQAVGLIVGLPVHMSGDEGEKAQQARVFGDGLSRACAVPVAYFDERFTTKMANAAMIDAGLSRGQRKARVDKLAATIMLQTYLDRKPGRDMPDLSD